VTYAATTAAIGFAIALAIGHPLAAICGFVVLGLGLSIVVPVTVSQAGRVGAPTATAPAVALVSSLGQLGPILGPPVIGFLAEPVGLPAALGSISVLATISVVLMQVVHRLTRPKAADEIYPEQRDELDERSPTCP
jgi:MFS family permease